MSSGYLDVKSNSPEELKQLATEGWYPGKKYMNCRMVGIEMPRNLMPMDASPVDIHLHPNSDDKVIVYFGHKKFKTIPEGACIPVIGSAGKR